MLFLPLTVLTVMEIRGAKLEKIRNNVRVHGSCLSGCTITKKKWNYLNAENYKGANRYFSRTSGN